MMQNLGLSTSSSSKASKSLMVSHCILISSGSYGLLPCFLSGSLKGSLKTEEIRARLMALRILYASG
ncbi:hypothetical protein D7231_09755 [Streptomyces klenkii]|uniref:Uncharacterized protein n=1 Tax=Streptomyces klenkii TaxID=1420899 RepID=A0A3B0BRZ5_9ACTN|nr:hypothetical protein D7231_09755 [Streptomyces klenkii]